MTHGELDLRERRKLDVIDSQNDKAASGLFLRNYLLGLWRRSAGHLIEIRVHQLCEHVAIGFAHCPAERSEPKVIPLPHPNGHLNVLIRRPKFATRLLKALAFDASQMSKIIF